MTTLIENLTDKMEVIETTYADSPDAAARQGEREARKYRAMGWACECIGVAATVKEIPFAQETDERLAAGYGMVKGTTRTTYLSRTVYHPVIYPAPPAGE